jgi:spore germination cell wall hydrolase CwlJ-like protein
MIPAALFCIAQVVYHEARSDPIEGRVAVAQVVLNRAGRDLERVCSETKRYRQFATPVPIREPKAWRRALDVARAAPDIKDYTNGATHFHTAASRAYWAQGMVYVGQWGAHKFYREPLRRAGV